jgi:enoyl-CoA hydratase
MPFENLLVEDRDTVRVITVNRPDKLNALNAETLAELHAAFDAAEAADGVRVVVLTGAGPKAFVAGADISQMNGLTPVQARDFSRRGQALMRRIEGLAKPVIAMVNGFALGGGMELAMACHLRVAADTAKLGQPEINLGLIPGFGGTQRLLRLAGRSAALELCLLGAPVDAARAQSLNLVQRVVPAAELEAQVMAMAAQLASAAPQALRGILDAILLAGEAPLEVGLDYETQCFALAFSTDDMKEGTGAFLERRKPVFRGT